MCRLKIKLQINGSKHNKFKKIIILPRNKKINGKIKEKLGFWDTRLNKKLRYILLNIYKLMYLYSFVGLTPNKKSLNIIYYYLIGKNVKNTYFNNAQIKIFLEDEIKQKFNK